MPRPSKYTKQVHATIVLAVKAGNYLKVAAAAAGIDESTLRAWMTSTRKPYTDLQKDVRKAQAEFEAFVVGSIGRRASDHPSAAFKLLTRRHPQRWGEARDRVPLPGPDPDSLELPDAKRGVPRLWQEWSDLPGPWRGIFIELLTAAYRGLSPAEFFERAKGVDPSLKEDSEPPREWWERAQEDDVDTPAGNE